MVGADVHLRHRLLVNALRQANGCQIRVAECIHIDPHPLVRVVVVADEFDKVSDLLEVI